MYLSVASCTLGTLQCNDYIDAGCIVYGPRTQVNCVQMSVSERSKFKVTAPVLRFACQGPGFTTGYAAKWWDSAQAVAYHLVYQAESSCCAMQVWTSGLLQKVWPSDTCKPAVCVTSISLWHLW